MMPSNPLYTSRQPVNTLLRLASDTPEYQQMANYLMARSAMPTTDFRYLGETKGEFDRSKRFIGGGSDTPNGEVSLNSGFLEYNMDPRDAVRTFGHELTHAAWNEIRNQIYAGNASPELVDAFSKLVYNKKTNRWAAPEMANKLNPDWLKENQGYRASVDELPAFGVGSSMMGGSEPRWKVPSHLDSTLATEQMIMLDLATRDAKRNPVKTQR